MIISSHSFDPNTGLEAAIASSSDPKGVGKHSELEAGTSRAAVIAQYGAPDATSYERNRQIDVYYLDDRPRLRQQEEEEVENTNTVIIEALSLGSVDVLLTPLAIYERVRIATGHTNNKLFLTYSVDDKLESAVKNPAHAASPWLPDERLVKTHLKPADRTVYAIVQLDRAATPAAHGVSPGMASYSYIITPGEWQDALVTTLQECGLFKSVTTLGQENIKADYQLQGEMISLDQAYETGCKDGNMNSLRNQVVVKYVLTKVATDIVLWHKTLTTCSQTGTEAAMQENLAELVRGLASFLN
jgi:hypothetical protein